MEPNLTMARHAATRDLLGAFALGAVDAEEAATVRAHLATCAECQAEIAELWLRGRQPARHDRADGASPGAARPHRGGDHGGVGIPRTARASASPAPDPVPAIAPAPPVPEPIRKPASFWSRATPWAAAAAILLLLSAGLLVWNLRLHEQIATAPVAETIALAPTDAAPGCPRRGHLSPAGRSLHPRRARSAAAGTGSGLRGLADRRGWRPVPAGVFDQPTDQHAIVADRDQYDTLAITAEPGPLGTEAPTGEIVATASL